MLIKFVEHILGTIDKATLSYSETLRSGNVQNFENYKFICGKIQGLEEAKAILEDLMIKWKAY